MYEQNELCSTVVRVACCHEEQLGNSNHAELQALYQAGWQVLINSAHNNLTQKCHYRAVAFVNKCTYEVHVAHTGTLVTNFYDLRDKVKLLFNQIPSKLKLLKFFVKKMIAQLGGEEAALNYTFSSSGHSLGAILSDLMAAELISRKLTFYQSYTFKNPGSCKLIECAIKRNCLSGRVSLGEVQSHCSYNNTKRNFINTLKFYLGDVIQLVKVKKNSQEIVGLPGTQSFLARIILSEDEIHLAKLIVLINQRKLFDISVQNTFSTTGRDNPDSVSYNNLLISSLSVVEASDAWSTSSDSPSMFCDVWAADLSNSNGVLALERQYYN